MVTQQRRHHLTSPPLKLSESAGPGGRGGGISLEIRSTVINFKGMPLLMCIIKISCN